MAVYSEVVLVIEKDFHDVLLKHAGEDVTDLLGYATSVKGAQGAIRYDWKMTKWYEDEEGVDNYELHQLLEELNDDGDKYRIWKLTSDYMWEEYAPLDTWGCYRHPELDPKITLEFEPYHGVLKEPLTIEEILLLKNENNVVKGVVEVRVDEMISSDLEGFFDILSERLVGGPLRDINYSVVASEGKRLLIEVSGNVTPLLEEN